MRNHFWNILFYKDEQPVVKEKLEIEEDLH